MKQALRWTAVKDVVDSNPTKAMQIQSTLRGSWKTYMEKLCSLPATQFLEAVPQSSLVGAPVTVQACRTPHLVGVSGTVVWDTETFVHLLAGRERPTVHSVPVASSVFVLDLPEGVAAKYGHPQLVHTGENVAWQ
jgi:RNase P/RNase MRP subunit p29